MVIDKRSYKTIDQCYASSAKSYCCRNADCWIIPIKSHNLYNKKPCRNSITGSNGIFGIIIKSRFTENNFFSLILVDIKKESSVIPYRVRNYRTLARRGLEPLTSGL